MTRSDSLIVSTNDACSSRIHVCVNVLGLDWILIATLISMPILRMWHDELILVG